MTWIWPQWVIPHIAGIKKRLADGDSLDEIAKSFHEGWEIEAKKYVNYRTPTKYSLERAERNFATDEFADWVSEAIYDFFREIGVERPGRIDDRIQRAVAKASFINSVQDMIRSGRSPVLIASKDTFAVTADIALSPLLASAAAQSKPVLVMPIRNKFLEAFASVEPTLADEPYFEPISEAIERDGKKTRRRRFQVDDNWNVEFD